MEDRIQVLTHKGRKIIYVDNLGLKADEIIANIAAMTKRQLAEKIVLACMNVADTTVNDAIKQAGAESHATLDKALGMNYSAILGLKNIQKILANAMKKGQYFADSREEALDWLAAQVK